MRERRSRTVARAVFVDSSAFFAVLDHNDPHNAEAQAILARAAAEGFPLVTSNFVIAESHALILTRMSRDAATRFLRTMEATEMRIVRATVQDEAAARVIIYRYSDKTFSLTDAISFAMMQCLGIDVAFAFDRHFRQFGFQIIEP